jgi:urease accessory protein
LQGHKVFSQLLMYPADEDILARARQVAADPAWKTVGQVGVTLVDGLLVVRVLGDVALQVQALLQTMWSRLRPLVMDHPPCAPRIWAT